MNWRLAASAGLLSVLAGLPARAEAADPCKDDVGRLCSGVQPGGGRIVECLKAHSDQLSEGCKDRFKQQQFEAENIRESCGDDVKSLCGGVTPGGGRIVECLRDHEAEASAGCREALDASHDAGGPCADDAKKFCPGKRGPERQQCLKAHAADLSPACRDRASGKDAPKGKKGSVPDECKADVEQLCKDASYGGNPLILNCLRSYDDKLTPTCKHALGI